MPGGLYGLGVSGLLRISEPKEGEHGKESDPIDVLMRSVHLK